MAPVLFLVCLLVACLKNSRRGAEREFLELSLMLDALPAAGKASAWGPARDRSSQTGGPLSQLPKRDWQSGPEATSLSFGADTVVVQQPKPSPEL